VRHLTARSVLASASTVPLTCISLFGALGCATSLSPAAGQLRLDVPELRGGVVEGVGAGAPVLEGTRVCPTIRCGDLCENRDLEVGHCFAQRIEGPGFLESGCLHTTGAGPIAWSFDRLPCELDDSGYAATDDVLELTVVAATEVTARIDFWPERGIARTGVLEGEPPIVAAPGEALRILEESEFHVSVMLVHPSFAAPVVYEAASGTLRVSPTAGRPPVVVNTGPAEVRLTGFEGTRAALHFDHPALGSPIASEVAFVAPETIVSLGIAVAYEAQDGARGNPMGARAVALDRGGHPVMGIPVTWGVAEGRLGLTPADALPGFDYASVDGGCARPPTQGQATRSATLEVDFAGHRATQEVTWIQPADAGWSEPGDCVAPQDGCQCGSNPGTGARFPWILGLLLLQRRSTRRR